MISTASAAGASRQSWDVAAIRRDVQTYAGAESVVDDRYVVREICLKARSFRGHPTSAFAYVARPLDSAVHPGVLLLHGGGGRAYREWALQWAKQGYVAMAVDLFGQGADGSRSSDGGPGLEYRAEVSQHGSADGGWIGYSGARMLASATVFTSTNGESWQASPARVDETRGIVTGSVARDAKWAFVSLCDDAGNEVTTEPLKR